MKKVLAVSLLLVTSMASAETCKLQTYASSWMATGTPFSVACPVGCLFRHSGHHARASFLPSRPSHPQVQSAPHRALEKSAGRRKNSGRPRPTDCQHAHGWRRRHWRQRPHRRPLRRSLQILVRDSNFDLSRSPSSPPAATSTSSPASSLKSSQSADEPVLPAFPPPPLPLPNNTDPLTSAPTHSSRSNPRSLLAPQHVFFPLT